MSQPSIYEKAFAKTDKTDAILVVEEKKMHVNKALLSYHSDYFNTLFNSEFKEKSMEEIEIKDVQFENFATLLSLLQEDPLNYEKPQVEELLKLADRFLLKGTKLQIGHFIASAASFSRLERLQLADKYNMERVFQSALSQYTCRGHFQEFCGINWNSFSSEAKSKIADKFFIHFAFKL